jgi:methylmalonyl-CoA/ethylmalonyl-CoA epimerase
MLTRIDHVGIACRDLDERVGFYETIFGLSVAHTEVNEAQGVARSCSM